MEFNSKRKIYVEINLRLWRRKFVPLKGWKEQGPGNMKMKQGCPLVHKI